MPEAGTTRLETGPRLEDPDGFYAKLVGLHAGLDEEASRRLDARLILILANHIGDARVLDEALARAAAATQRGE